MTTATAPQAGAAPAPRPAAAAPRRWVSDAPTRTVHLLFALAFAGAWLSGDSERWRALHASFGWTLLALLAFRVAYGFVGPRPQRLAVLARKLAALPGWLRSLAAGRVDVAQGRALVLALAVAAMLALAAPLVASGWAADREWGGEAVADVHEALGSLMLAAVALHLTMLAAAAALQRRNPLAPMFGGRVAGPGPHLVPAQRRWLAAAVVAAVLALWGWQWAESPAGLLPTAALRDRAAADDD